MVEHDEEEDEGEEKEEESEKFRVGTMLVIGSSKTPSFPRFPRFLVVPWVVRPLVRRRLVFPKCVLKI